MAPTSGRGKTTRKASNPRRSSYKKKPVKPSKTNSTSPVLSGEDEFDHSDCIATTTATPCSTPKAQRFRIPEMDACPPAPKKRRSLPSKYSLRTTPIAFFAPPDIELFFFCAFSDISLSS
ncbi:hypothetical protein HRI_002905000 [Hibiscus trionum]|uniref:Uncharacterized protein n=1 Tax=Hibiscus trionum TaxID=183268 RepID=A0A9W7M6Y3_HIBTR|nr:hypothetical protein HRI_002905000 [Hibiscus trionum]